MLIAGGLVLAIGALLQGINHPGDPFSQQVTTTQFVASAGLRLVGAGMCLIGLTALYCRQADRAGRFGLIAYLLVVLNMILQLAWMWSDLFVTDMLSKQAPGLLDGTVDQGRLGVAFMLAWVANTSLVLLGAATLRARVFRRTTGWALVGAGAVTLVPLPVDGPWFEVIIGLCLVVAGWAARDAGADLATGASDDLRLSGAATP